MICLLKIIALISEFNVQSKGFFNFKFVFLSRWSSNKKMKRFEKSLNSFKRHRQLVNFLNLRYEQNNCNTSE